MVICTGGVTETSVVVTGEPGGSVGSSRRVLAGSENGSVWLTGLNATMASSSGFILTVSFQPISLSSGGLMAPSQPTRLITWTLKRWKCTGWVSTPLWVIFHIWG